MTDNLTYFVKTNFLVDHVNYQLKHAESTQEERFALIALLESALFEAGSYVGYAYLTPDELPEGVTPGVRYYGEHANFVGADSSRRRYYPKGA